MPDRVSTDTSREVFEDIEAARKACEVSWDEFLRLFHDVFQAIDADRSNREMSWDQYFRVLPTLLDGASVTPATEITGDVQASLDREAALHIFREMAGDEALLSIDIDTDRLARDIAGYASGADFDPDVVAEEVAARIESDVREMLADLVVEA